MTGTLEGTRAATQGRYMGLHWLYVANRRVLCQLRPRICRATPSPAQQISTSMPLQHAAHARWQPSALVASAAGGDGQQGVLHSKDEGAGSLQGWHHRRRSLQGLVAQESLSIPAVEGAVRAAPILHGLAAPGPQDNRRTAMAGAAMATPLPPHLAAKSRPSQQEAASPAPLKRPLPDSSAGQQTPTRHDCKHVDGSTGGTVLSNGKAASSTAAELIEDNGKAEGVLQFGSSGARIPLYGRSVESILQARACSCLMNRCTGVQLCGASRMHLRPWPVCPEMDARHGGNGQAVSQDIQKAARGDGLYSSGSADEGEDALAVAFDQLPGRWQQRRRDFDWSGGTNYTAVHRKVCVLHVSRVGTNSSLLYLRPQGGMRRPTCCRAPASWSLHAGSLVGGGVPSCMRSNAPTPGGGTGRIWTRMSRGCVHGACAAAGAAGGVGRGARRRQLGQQQFQRPRQ